jgi:S-adenosylmethionine hydrolase
VTNVDRFGNVITNILSLHWLDEHTLRFTPVPAQAEQMAFPPSFKAAEASVTIGWHTLRGIHATYGNVSPGQAVAIVGSNHDLEIAVNQGRAADTLGIKTGTPVILRV